MAEQAQQVASAPDPTARIAPALSATSDAPVVESVPDPKPDEVVEQSKPEAEKPDGESVEKPENAEGESETPEQIAAKADKTPAWLKKEAAKLRAAARDADTARTAAETRAATAEANLKKALEAVEKLTGESAAGAKRAAESKDPRPVRDAFDNPDAYDSALVEWAGRTAAAAATAAVEAKAEADKRTQTEEAMRTKTAAENKVVLDAYLKRVEKFTEDHPDYEDVAQSDDIKISIPMAAVIMNDEDGPAIAYYLGQNPDEAERISTLTPARVGAELGRIAARLNAKPAVSTKPKPIKPLKTGEAPASARKSPNEESMEEYAARRQPELRGRSNGMSTSH